MRTVPACPSTCARSKCRHASSNCWRVFSACLRQFLFKGLQDAVGNLARNAGFAHGDALRAQTKHDLDVSPDLASRFCLARLLGAGAQRRAGKSGADLVITCGLRCPTHWSICVHCSSSQEMIFSVVLWHLGKRNSSEADFNALMQRPTIDKIAERRCNFIPNVFHNQDIR